MILHNRIITIIFIFIALAISFFIGIPTTVSAACTIADGNAKFVNHHGDQAETWYSAGSRTLNIKVTATDCVGQALDIKLMEVDLTSNDVIEELEITVPSNGIIDIAILAGENYCSTTTLGSANDCELYLAVHLAGSSTVLHTSYPHPQGRLNYECAGECADAWEIVSSTPAVNVGSTNTAGTSCEIQSAKFMNYHGVQSDTWFSDEYARLLHIQIIAPDCANEKIYPSLTEVDNIPFVDLINDDVNELDDRDVRVPANGKLDLYIWVGEAECEQTVGADCDLYLEIQTSANADGISFGPTYSSYEEPQGRLRYDCDDGCLNWWKLASTINADKTVNNNVPNVCNVTNASFSPSGTQEADFYSDELQPLVEVAIQTEHCTGHPIKVSVVNKSRGDTTVSSAITGGFVGGVMLGPAGIIPGAITAVLLDGDNNVQAIDEKEIRVPSSGLVTMALKVGEDHCSFVSETGGYEQCIYYLQITNPAGYTFTFLKENSVLNYKCTGTVSGSQTNCAPIKNGICNHTTVSMEAVNLFTIIQRRMSYLYTRVTLVQ